MPPFPLSFSNYHFRFDEIFNRVIFTLQKSNSIIRDFPLVIIDPFSPRKMRRGYNLRSKLQTKKKKEKNSFQKDANQHGRQNLLIPLKEKIPFQSSHLSCKTAKLETRARQSCIQYIDNCVKGSRHDVIASRCIRDLQLPNLHLETRLFRFLSLSSPPPRLLFPLPFLANDRERGVDTFAEAKSTPVGLFPSSGERRRRPPPFPPSLTYKQFSSGETANAHSKETR